MHYIHIQMFVEVLSLTIQDNYKSSWCDVDSRVTRLWARWPSNCGYIPSSNCFLFPHSIQSGPEAHPMSY